MWKIARKNHNMNLQNHSLLVRAIITQVYLVTSLDMRSGTIKNGGSPSHKGHNQFCTAAWTSPTSYATNVPWWCCVLHIHQPPPPLCQLHHAARVPRSHKHILDCCATVDEGRSWRLFDKYKPFFRHVALEGRWAEHTECIVDVCIRMLKIAPLE